MLITNFNTKIPPRNSEWDFSLLVLHLFYFEINFLSLKNYPVCFLQTGNIYLIPLYERLFQSSFEHSQSFFNLKWVKSFCCACRHNVNSFCDTKRYYILLHDYLFLSSFIIWAYLSSKYEPTNTPKNINAVIHIFLLVLKVR